MNNLMTYLISCFLLVNLYADQGMLSGITLNTTYSTDDTKDICMKGDALYSITDTMLSKYNKITAQLEANITIETDAKKVLATQNYVFILKDRQLNVYNSDLNVSEGNFTSSKFFNTFTFSNDNKYIFIGTTIGILIVDITDIANITDEAFIESTNAKYFAKKEDYLYVADDWGGLKVIDVRDPRISTILSKVEGQFSKVFVENDYLYTIGSNGLSSFDLTSPSAPLYKATTNTSGSTDSTSLLVHDMYAYIGQNQGIPTQFNIYDVSNKSSMQNINYNLSMTINAMLGEDENIYFATDSGFVKYDAKSDYDDNITAASQNQIAKTIQNLGSDQGVFGNISDVNDTDFIKVNLQNGRLIATVSGLSELNVSVYDSDNIDRAPVISEESDLKTKTLSINKEVASGIHYIKVEPLGDETGEYKIVADFTQDDWTDNKTSAYLINLDETIKGNMFNRDDKDYFRVDLTSKGIINIISNDTDVVDFEIENSYDDTSITGDGDLAISKEYFIPSSGVYYIYVKARSDDVEDKDYSFRVSFSKNEILDKEDDAPFAFEFIKNIVDSSKRYTLISSEGNYIYVVDSNEQTIIRKNKSDLSDAGSYSVNEQIVSYALIGDYIYLLSYSKLTILYKSMNFRSSIATQRSNNKKIKVNADFAYISSFDSNIEIIDISNKDLLITAGSVNIFGNINDFDIKASFSDDTVNELKTYLYIATDNGLKIYDFSNSANVNLIQTYKENNRFTSITISNPYAYVATNNTLSVLYVKRPTSSPKLKSSIYLNNTRDIVINQDFAYVINDSNYLKIVDIKDQTSLKIIDTALFSAKSIYVEDGLGFIIQFSDIKNNTVFDKIAVYDMSKDYASLKGKALPIEFDKNNYGVISKHRSDDKDMFYINITSSSELNILANGEINITYELFNFNQDTTVDSFDAIAYIDSNKTIKVDAGEYYLQVSATNELNGTYEFTINKEEDDYSDIFTGAAAILLSNNYDANISANDIDIVKITLEQRGTFTFITDANISSELYYDDTSTLIASDNTSVLSVILNPGTYYIKMKSINSYSGNYTFSASLSSNGELSMPYGFDDIKNFNSSHVLYGERYIYVIENGNYLSVYNHLLQRVEKKLIEDGTHNYAKTCAQPFVYEDKIFINNLVLENGLYNCRAYSFIEIESFENSEKFIDEYIDQNIEYSNIGFNFSVNDIIVVNADNDYLYEYSDLNNTLFKSSYNSLREYSKKPYGIFNDISSVDDIKAVKNDGNLDFLAINDTLIIYKTNPEYKTYDDVNKSLVVKVEPIIITSKLFSQFEGNIEDIYLDRDSKKAYVIDNNSTALKIVDYDTNSIDDANITKVDLEYIPNGIYVKENKIYISFANYGMKIYQYPLSSSSVALKSIPNIGPDISKPFSYDGTTLNYLSRENPQVFYLSNSFLDGTTSGSYSVIDKVKEGENSEGCFIATAAYGSYFTSHVKVLRDFRDSYLLTNSFGRAFVKFYYKHSPAIAAQIADSDALKGIIRSMLTPLVYVIKYPLIFLVAFLLFIGGFIIRKYLSKREVSIS